VAGDVGPGPVAVDVDGDGVGAAHAQVDGPVSDGVSGAHREPH